MKRIPVLCSITLLLLAAGCGSTPTRFYTLSPLSDGGPARTAPGTELTLGLGPVELPKSLDRPQIVTRRGQNEFDLGEFDHWAEPLEDNVTAVLAENLAVLLPAQRVVVYPWDRSKDIDYQVVVKVLRFDRSIGGDAVLQVRWSLKSPTNENELLARETRYAKRPAGEDYQATVAAMNQVLNDFSRDVAAAVQGLRGGSS
jgi:uncharacterized lipoprotein YmbA